MKPTPLNLGKHPPNSRVPKDAGPPPEPNAAESDAGAPTVTEAGLSGQILRFRKSEISLHWSIAIPVMVCYATGFILKVFYNLHSGSVSQDVFSWIHRIAGAGLIVFPLFAAIRNWRDYRVHLDNIKVAWTWTIDDLKWLVLMGAAAVSRRITLPDQHKFNAAEKLNFMMVMCTYPLFIATGLLLWMPGLRFWSWVIHVALAMAITPLLLGHIYMALVNPGTRVGLGGMISGYVDRQWARHHYRRWYREVFGDDAKGGAEVEEVRSVLRRPPRLRCAGCRADHVITSWLRLLEMLHEVQPIKCPNCGADANIVSVVVDPGDVDSILSSLDRVGGRGLLVERLPDSGDAIFNSP